MRSLLGRFHRPNARSQTERLFMLNNLGDGSTLSLDFTTGVLDSRLDFTRASTTATYINSSGYVTTAGTNVPRFDYDPTTLAPRGLLIEGSATNLALRSGDFNTTVTDGTQWIASGYTAGTLSTTLPDGTTGNARRISMASGSGSFRSSTITVTASTAYTFSFWARNNGGSQARFRVWNATAGSSIVDYTQSVNNYVSQIGGANNTSSTWVRVSVQFTTPAGCTAIYVYPCSSDAGTVDLLIWGAQVETGSGASSYIPTGASQATRNADSCVMTGTNFSSWFNATEGTLLAHAIRGRTSDIGRIATVNDNTANESIELAADTSGEFIVVDGGSTLANITPGTVTANTAFKIAGAYKLNDVQAALGGTLGVADTAVTMPTVDRLMIGQQAGASPVYLNGTIALLKYWPTRLPNAQLQSLTT
jgi:hypothetical protein